MWILYYFVSTSALPKSGAHTSFLRSPFCNSVSGVIFSVHCIPQPKCVNVSTCPILVRISTPPSWVAKQKMEGCTSQPGGIHKWVFRSWLHIMCTRKRRRIRMLYLSIFCFPSQGIEHGEYENCLNEKFRRKNSLKKTIGVNKIPVICWKINVLGNILYSPWTCETEGSSFGLWPILEMRVNWIELKWQRNNSITTEQLLRKIFVFDALPPYVPGVNINIIMCVWY